MMTGKKITNGLMVAVVGVVVTLTSATAQTVIQPIGATTTAVPLSGRPIENAIDGSGLSGVGDILTQTHSVNVNADLFLGSGDTGHTFVFDLGGTYTVDSVHLWA